MDDEVRNRDADHASGLHIVLGQTAVCHMHSGFSNPVHIDQLRRLVAVPVEPRL